MMKKYLFFALLTLAGLLAAGDMRKQYPFVKQVRSDGKSSTFAIRLDHAIYKQLDQSYSNLLLMDKTGGLIPFAIRDLRKKSQRQVVEKQTCTIRDFRFDPQTNTAEIDLDTPGSAAINEIEFLTDLQRFNKQVSITFLDKKNQILRRDEGLKLYRYDKLSGGPTVRFDTIKARKFRIVIHRYMEKTDLATTSVTTGQDGITTRKNVRAEELNIRQINLFYRYTKPAPGERIFRAFPLPEISRIQAGNNTVMTWDGGNVPLSKIVITAENKHYCRTAHLRWQDADGKCLHQKTFEIAAQKTEISLPEQRSAKLVLTVENGDNAPLQNMAVHFQAPDKVLLAEQNGTPQTMTLYYGGNAPRRIYDIQQYADKLLLEDHAFYHPGPEEKSPFYEPSVPKEKITRSIMWVVLTLVGLLLLGVIFKLLRTPATEPDGR